MESSKQFQFIKQKNIMIRNNNLAPTCKQNKICENKYMSTKKQMAKTNR